MSGVYSRDKAGSTTAQGDVRLEYAGIRRTLVLYSSRSTRSHVTVSLLLALCTCFVTAARADAIAPLDSSYALTLGEQRFDPLEGVILHESKASVPLAAE